MNFRLLFLLLCLIGCKEPEKFKVVSGIRIDSLRFRDTISEKDRCFYEMSRSLDSMLLYREIGNKEMESFYEKRMFAYQDSSLIVHQDYNWLPDNINAVMSKRKYR